MPHRLLAPLAALAALLVCLPSADAGPRHARPLADVPPPPDARGFRDHVGPPARPATAGARAAQARARVHRTRDGHTVRVAVSPAYANPAEVAGSYVDFIAGLPHGAELSELQVAIVTPEEVGASCGATRAVRILACYLPGEGLMIVPGEELEGTRYTTSYVVAHEYGHHVAAHRSHAPFRALDHGPKRWASQENVCAHTLEGRLAPGDEGDAYADNPGEAWAEAYAQLRYPGLDWRYSSLLSPDPASAAAARRDVTAPWSAYRTRTFTGALAEDDRTDRHAFRLTLDGALAIELAGPADANFDLDVHTGGRRMTSTRAGGSRDRVGYRVRCVRDPERITVTVRRRSGAGPYRLTARYAG